MKILHRFSSVGRIATHVGEVGILGEIFSEGVGIVLVPRVDKTKWRTA